MLWTIKYRFTPVYRGYCWYSSEVNLWFTCQVVGEFLNIGWKVKDVYYLFSKGCNYSSRTKEEWSATFNSNMYSMEMYSMMRKSHVRLCYCVCQVTVTPSNSSICLSNAWKADIYHNAFCGICLMYERTTYVYTVSERNVKLKKN
jgi:hypothetical protein